MTRYARLAVILFFVGLLLTPFLIRRLSQPAGATAASGDADPLTHYGFRLTESSKAAGLDFVHGAPTLDPKLSHIMPQVASMGAAVSVVDVDRDGLSDLYVTDSQEGSRNRLFRNRGNGTFEDVAARLGVADLESCRDRRVDGRGVGGLRQRRLRGSLRVSLGPPGSLSQRSRAGLHACDRYGRTARVGERQHRGVVRLRLRRPPRPLRRRLLPRDGEPLEARRHAHDAGELRVREQRRAEVSLPQSWRGQVRGGERARGARVAALGAGGGGG